MTRMAVRLGGVLVVTLVSIGGTAPADEMSVMEEVLMMLREEGRLSEGKYRDLLERYEKERGEAPSASVYRPSRPCRSMPSVSTMSRRSLSGPQSHTARETSPVSLSVSDSA